MTRTLANWLLVAALALLLLVLLLAPRPGHAQSVLKHFLSVGSSTNSTLVHGGPTLVTHIVAGNNTAVLYWLKLIGLGWCLVAGIADNNDGAAAAGVAINMGVTRY